MFNIIILTKYLNGFIVTNKFKTLTKLAFPDIFLYDLKSDELHNKLSYDDFHFIQYELIGKRETSKDIIH